MRIYPARHRYIIIGARQFYCKAGDTDHHDFGGEGYCAFPMRFFVAVHQRSLLYLFAIGDYGVVLRGRDDELDRRFVRRMVHAGKPMVGPVGPVVAKEGAIAKFIFGDDEAIGGNAAVGNLQS